MDPIPDLAALRPILESLKAKRLIVSLSSEGRGHVLSHALYMPEEMAALRASFDGSSATAVSSPAMHTAMPISPPVPSLAARSAPLPVAQAAPQSDRLTREVESLRAEVGQLRRDLEELTEHLRRTDDELHEMRESLGG
jgi:hypothetical protein